MGNLYRAVPDEAADATIRTALSLSFRHFDTAPHYGLRLSKQRFGGHLVPGRSRRHGGLDQRGRLLKPNGELDPTQFAVPATLRRCWDYSPAGVHQSLEASLERPQLDLLQVLYLHDPDVYDLDGGVASTLPALHSLPARD